MEIRLVLVLILVKSRRYEIFPWLAIATTNLYYTCFFRYINWRSYSSIIFHRDGLVQTWRNSIPDAMESSLFQIKQSNICPLSPLLQVIYQVNGRSVDLEDEEDGRTIDEVISDAAGGRFYFNEKARLPGSFLQCMYCPTRHRDFRPMMTSSNGHIFCITGL